MKFKLVNYIFLFVTLGLLFVCYSEKVSFYYLILPILVWLFLTTFGAFQIRWNYFLNAFHQKNTTEKFIALTFDDGPTKFTPRILDILEKNNAKATFFCIGLQIEKHADILQKTFLYGHILGNHTYHHSQKNGFYSTEKIMEEINLTDQIIVEKLNVKPKLFRPPFGVTNPHIAKALAKTQHQVIGWSVRSLDTVIDDELKLLNRIKRQIKPGSIILMHDTSDKTANVLEQLFVFLHEENYKVVPLDQLLNIKKYEN